MKMALKIADHELEGISVLALDGRIVLGEKPLRFVKK
jgi:hypothetical protein